MHSIEHITHNRDGGTHRITLYNHIIGYILHGTLRIYGSEVQNIQQGMLFILRAGNYRVEYLSEEFRLYEEIIIHLSPTTLRNITHSIPNLNIEPSTHTATIYTQLNTPHILSLYFQEIQNYLMLKVFDRCESMELIKINELVNLILYQPTSSIAQSLLQLIGLDRMGFVKHIQTSLFRNVTIERLAHECGMSLPNFKLTFQRQFSCSPHHWFITHRLHTVCTLLEHTCDPIKTIANECGFSSPSHMIRLFRNHYGTTPTQYRATHNQHLSILNNHTILLK